MKNKQALETGNRLVSVSCSLKKKNRNNYTSESSYIECPILKCQERQSSTSGQGHIKSMELSHHTLVLRQDCYLISSPLSSYPKFGGHLTASHL